MSLSFKFVPLTFLKDQTEIRRQVRNTVIISHFFERNDNIVPLDKFIEGTQYGYNASALQSGKNKFLRISDITDGKVDWGTVPFCDCVDEETYLLFPDDILIARTGGTTGKSFKINDAPDGAIFAGYLIRIRANENCIPDFLNVFLNSYSYWSQIVFLNEGEFRPSVNANKLRDLLLPNCSKGDQIDIVRLSNGENVEGYEGLISRIEESLKGFNSSIEISQLLESQKERVSQLKQSILQEAIQGKLTEEWRTNRQAQGLKVEPTSELLKRIKAEKAKLIKEKKIKKEKPLPPITEAEKPFELPDGWEWCKMGDLCSKTGSGSTPSGGKTVYLNEGIKFIRSQNVYDDGLRLDDVAFISSQIHKKMNGTVVQSEDLLLNITGGSIGRCCIVPTDFDEGNINQHVAIIRSMNSGLGFFLHKIICSPYFQDQIIKAQTGAGREGLPKNKMDNILIGLPNEDEQKGIVEKVEALMEKCRELEEEINQSEQHAQMLMQAVLKEAFEGKN